MQHKRKKIGKFISRDHEIHTLKRGLLINDDSHIISGHILEANAHLVELEIDEGDDIDNYFNNENDI